MSTSVLDSLGTSTDDQELIEASIAGDVAAFAILVSRYDRKVFRIAFGIAQNREDAQDVVQEAFLRAFAKLRQFSGNSSFYTWLVSITVNQALMKLRSRRRVKLCSLEGEDGFDLNIVEQIPQQSIPNPEQLCYTSELNRLLTRSLVRLSPRLRAVFVLRDVDGLSMMETAETLNITIAAVKARLFRARHLLRKELSKYSQHGHSPLGGEYGRRFGASAGI